MKREHFLALINGSEYILHKLLQSNGEFRDLCIEHLLCTSQLLAMRNKEHRQGQLLDEFDTIQRQLEDEIATFLPTALTES